jgi:hypothetical protein
MSGRRRPRFELNDAQREVVERRGVQVGRLARIGSALLFGTDAAAREAVNQIVEDADDQIRERRRQRDGDVIDTVGEVVAEEPAQPPAAAASPLDGRTVVCCGCGRRVVAQNTEGLSEIELVEGLQDHGWRQGLQGWKCPRCALRPAAAPSAPTSTGLTRRRP